MADKAISELTPASEVLASDLFVLEQGNVAKKLTGQILENWLVSFADGHGGIQSIEKTGTSGLVDTYTITLADETTKTFTVTNGAQGIPGNSWYVHIKYANTESAPTQDSEMSSNPGKWIGIYSGTSSSAPTHVSSYTWYKYKGEQGIEGAPATVESTETVYGTSSSTTDIPSEWDDTIPSVSPGDFLWTKTTIEFNSGEPVTFYSTARSGIDGEGSVSSVCGVSPDASGNVALTDSNILPSMSGQSGKFLTNNGTASSWGTVQTLPSQTGKSGKYLKTDGTVASWESVVIPPASQGVQVTIAAANWSNKSATVNVTGVTASANIIVSPAPSSYIDYSSAQIRATAQGSGTVTFACETVPSGSVTVNVLIVG